MALNDVIAYYQQRLIAQYRDQPKARATVGIAVKQAVGDLLAFQVLNGFDLDTAVGPQLDIIGQYVGVSRQIGDPIPKPYFSFDSYSNSTPVTLGMQSYTDAGVNAGVLWPGYSDAGAANTALPDDQYRYVIRLQIVLNSCDGTTYGIQKYLDTMLGDQITVRDNQNMSATYVLGHALPVTTGVIKQFLPVPLGVAVGYEEMEAGASSNVANATQYVYSPAMVTVYSPYVTITPVGGTAPYSYRWEAASISEIALDNGTSPSATMRWRLYAGPDTTRTVIYRCIVSDSNGLIAYSEPISITLRVIYAP